jgi:hypothetical protein
MRGASKDVLTRLALLMLEELSLREGGAVRLRYWKTYRMVEFWLGEGVAQLIARRLAEGGYVKLEGGRAVLLKRLSTRRSLGQILRDAYALLTAGAAS